jgi:hypothetical protein
MIHIDYVPPSKNFIDNGPINEIIKLAKTRYNIFLPNSGKLYTEMCNKIKARLDREGLPYDVVKPD